MSASIKLKITDSDGIKKEVELYRASYALVIGVSKYNNGWPPLPGVVTDLDAVSASLEKQGFKVTTAVDLDAAALPATFADFIARYGNEPENRLLFYFAGHGHTIQPAYGGDPIGYIVPADAPLPGVDTGRFKQLAMSMQRIEEYALGINAKHAMFVFDACFSGSLFALSRAIPEHINYKTTQPVRQFITSGAADERVPDRSVFRDQFVDGIGGEADTDQDGYITGSELGAFLQKKVVNYSHGGQHPQFGAIRRPQLDKGDFVFVAPKSAASPAPVVENGEKKPVWGRFKNFLASQKAATAVTPISVDEPVAQSSDEEEMWYLVKDSSNPDDVRIYINEYPDGRYIGSAQLKLTQLERKQDKPVTRQEQVSHKGRIFIQPLPGNSRVRILNIKPRYRDGMELASGSYHVEVSASGYQTLRQWVEIEAGKDVHLPVTLNNFAANSAPIQQMPSFIKPVSIQDVSSVIQLFK